MTESCGSISQVARLFLNAGKSYISTDVFRHENKYRLKMNCKIRGLADTPTRFYSEEKKITRKLVIVRKFRSVKKSIDRRI